jgi:hypothetical protein
MAKQEKIDKQPKRPPAEKPISLAGASFKDVLAALLRTRPMPKEKDVKEEQTKKERGLEGR